MGRTERLKGLRRGNVARTVAAVLAALALPAFAQFPDPLSEAECPGCSERLVPARLDGIWSSALTSAAEPGWALGDYFCFAACTSEGRAEAERLLADAGTAHRPALELYPQAVAANVGSVERLSVGTADASKASRGQLPGFSCERSGLAAQVVSPLPLELVTEADRVTLRYEELGVERTVWLDEGSVRDRDRGPFGASKGRFERGVLIVETRGVAAGRLSEWLGGLVHSDALQATERYSVSAEGRWLDLELTLDDPATLVRPLVVTKRWLRTPHARLMRHGCDVMSAGLGGVLAEYLDPRIIDARRHGPAGD